MKLTRIVSILCLICCFAVGFVFSQSKKSEQKPIEIKANVLVKDLSDNFVDDIKAENLKIFEDGVEQKITYFVKKAPILNVGLVMDNTGSMRVFLEDVVTTGKGFTNYLIKQDEAFVVRFIDSSKIQLVQDWTSNQRLLNLSLDNMFIEGGQSAIIDGLYFAGQKILQREKTEKSRRYALILITDGEDRESRYNETQLFNLFIGTDVQIFPIAILGEFSKSKKKSIQGFINRLTIETGGTAFFPENKKLKDEIVAATRKIADELRSQYVIGYTSTNQKRDGLTRKLTVQVADNENGEKRQAFIREGFVIPKEKD